MQNSLPESARRVADLLRTLGHRSLVLRLPASGRTSAEAAAGLGCSVAEIAKSIVFRQLVDDTAVMVVASGAYRVDEGRVAALVGPLGKADAAFVREHTGYAIGGVCPLGHPRSTIVLVDRLLLAYDRIWAAAGHPHCVFSLSPQELLAMTGGQVADVAEVPAAGQVADVAEVPAAGQVADVAEVPAAGQVADVAEVPAAGPPPA